MDIIEAMQSNLPFETFCLVPKKDIELMINTAKEVSQIKAELALIRNASVEKIDIVTIADLSKITTIAPTNLLNYIKKGYLKRSVIKGHGKKLLNRLIALEELRDIDKINEDEIDETANFLDNDYLSIKDTANLYGIEVRSLRRAIDEEDFIPDCIVIGSRGKLIDTKKADIFLREFYSTRKTTLRNKRKSKLQLQNRKLAV